MYINVIVLFFVGIYSGLKRLFLMLSGTQSSAATYDGPNRRQFQLAYAGPDRRVHT